MRKNPVSVRYGIDGALVFGALHIVGTNNNLFAQRLGGGDFHLSLLQALPQMINLFLLIPAGLFIGSLAGKRRVVRASLVCGAVFFALAGMAGFVPQELGPVMLFLPALALGMVCMGLFNLSWQAFFPEVVDERGRNTVLTHRAACTMIVGLATPLLVGFVLSSIISDTGKIYAHQVFYFVAAAVLAANAWHFGKIQAAHPAAAVAIRRDQIAACLRAIKKSKPYLYFVGLVLFFHMSWHADWTLYFIGQANYLHMSEFMLAFTPVGAVAAQLLTISFWSRYNKRHGVEIPLTYGMIAIALCPIAMIAGLAIGPGAGALVFLLLNFGAHLGFACIALNLLQCLLRVTPAENRSFAISIYTLAITLSHATMPIAGVALYRRLGGNAQALMATFGILFVLRVVAAGLWYARARRSAGALEDE